tara:strand:- start:396 stop:773 length:378 start_codon:yes stop_codon:yes gene_type:complete
MKDCAQSILDIFLIPASYGDFKGSELDYSTTQIRKMWNVCFSFFIVNYPRILEQLKIFYANEMLITCLKKYSAKEGLKLSKEESEKLGAEVVQVFKIPEIINFTSSIPKSATCLIQVSQINFARS